MNNNELKLPDQELVSKFRALIQENEYQVSDELLLCFIRAKKNDLQRSLKLLKNYIKLVKNHPEICKDLQVEPLLDLFHSKIFSPLPDRDQHGRRVLIFDAHEWGNRIINMDAAVRGILLGLQMIVADGANQINGIVLIFDVKELKLHQVRQITPSFLAKMAILFEDAFPIVVKEAHVLHEPLVLKIIVAMMWPFMSDEIRSRVFFHGKCLESLHQHIDPCYLPSAYGGKKKIDKIDFLSVFKDKHPNIFQCFN